MAQCPESMDYWEKFHATELEAKIIGFRKHGRISVEGWIRLRAEAENIRTGR